VRGWTPLRFKKLEQELQKFVDCHKEMESLLSELRKTVKDEGMKLVTNHMKYERSEEAKRTIDELNEMSNLTFKSNAKDIEKYVMQIFNLTEGDLKESVAPKPIDDLPDKMAAEGEKSIDDVKKLLAQRGFVYKKGEQGHLEFQNNEDFYFIVPIFEEKTDEEIKELLHTKFRFRNIGFVCANQEIKAKIRKETEAWTKENKKKFHYLIVHFATFNDIAMTEEFFETIDYSRKKVK
jgi:hypothetical protein